mgnify:CR=1 FL=1
MSKFIKLLIAVVLFSVGTQLFAQDKEVVKEIVEHKFEQHQMMKYKEWEAMHKRFHMKEKRKIQADMKYKYMKRKKQKRIVTLFVVGGLSYYIGYEMGKDKHEGKPGGKKPPMIWRDKWKNYYYYR